MTARVPKRILRRLEEARRNASMETASFGMPADRVSLNGGPAVSKDQFVKEETRLYRNTWVLPALDEIIAWAKGSGDGKKS